MNFDLNNNVNQMILLFVVAVACLFGINLFQKRLGRNSMVAAVLVIVVACVVGYYIMNNNQESAENFFNPNETVSPIMEHFEGENNVKEEGNNGGEQPDINIEEPDGNAKGNNGNEVGAAPNDAVVNVANVSDNSNNNNLLNCKDLLPGDSSFNQTNPNTPGACNTGSLLNAGFHIGVDTQGCSLRNANRGLRSEPPNPQVQVSPWLQTTICPDLLRKPLESCE